MEIQRVYKIKNQYMLGKKGFRETILYRIKFIPSCQLSPLQNHDPIDPKKNCLLEIILLHDQESEFYTWFLFTKSKTHTCWAKRFQGNYPLQTQIHSRLLFQNHYRIKIWKYDIKGHALLENQRP